MDRLIWNQDVRFCVTAIGVDRLVFNVFDAALHVVPVRFVQQRRSHRKVFGSTQ